MPTVQEQLKAAGWSDADIAGFDATKLKGIETVLSVAEQNRQAAELAQRSANDMFENQITPALNTWGVKEANLAAERDYYKKLAEGAKDGGFIPEVPPFTASAARDGSGKFVANANTVPGSPDFKEFEAKVVGGMGTIADVQWKYRTLYGKEMPDAPTALGAEAGSQRMSMADWAAKKYDFAGRERTIADEATKANRDAIRKEAIEERDKYWAERGGSNPNVRQAETSRYAEVRKAVDEGTRPDPLKMSREERHRATAAAIQQERAATIQ